MAEDDDLTRKLEEVQHLLTPVPKRERPLLMLLAALFMTLCAFAFAATAIMAPPNVKLPMAARNVER
jgi:hypothetical protein